jgi:hypothetical protein
VITLFSAIALSLEPSFNTSAGSFSVEQFIIHLIWLNIWNKTVLINCLSLIFPSFQYPWPHPTTQRQSQSIAT